MTSCSLRRLQELAAQIVTAVTEAIPQATKESERASSLSECQSNSGAMTGRALASYVSAGLVANVRLPLHWPPLLPRFGGKRMPSGYVSTAVLRNAPFQAARTARFDDCAAKRPLTTHYQHKRVHMRWLFRAPVRYGREWQPGLREDHGHD